MPPLRPNAVPQAASDEGVRAVYVGGLPQGAQADTVRPLFESYGEVRA